MTLYYIRNYAFFPYLSSYLASISSPQRAKVTLSSNKSPFLPFCLSWFSGWLVLGRCYAGPRPDHLGHLRLANRWELGTLRLTWSHRLLSHWWKRWMVGRLCHSWLIKEIMKFKAIAGHSLSIRYICNNWPNKSFSKSLRYRLINDEIPIGWAILPLPIRFASSFDNALLYT